MKQTLRPRIARRLSQERSRQKTRMVLEGLPLGLRGRVGDTAASRQDPLAF
jgi:hypothetical protein